MLTCYLRISRMRCVLLAREDQQLFACQDAVMLGIPRTALPQIPDSPQTELEEYRSIHKRLSGMIASFMSSSL